MSFEYFISKKTLKSVVQGKKVSKPIVRISIISIAIAIIVNLITLAVVKGFKQEVRRKIVGFGGHIHMTSAGEGSLYESSSIRIKQDVLAEVKSFPNIKSISPIGFKPVLFQSKKERIEYQLPNGKDTFEINQQVQGAMIKGVLDSYDFSFFEENLVEGKIPNFSNQSVYEEILVSKKLCRDLSFKLNDTVKAFFVKNQPIQKRFIIKGIYETGLEEFDKKMVIGNLHLIQELNDWGIKTSLEIADTLFENRGLLVQARTTGGNGNYRFDFGNGFKTYNSFPICPQKDTTIRVIATDYWSYIDEEITESTLPDTSYLKIEVDRPGYCEIALNEIDEVQKEYTDSLGNSFNISDGGRTIKITKTDGLGSSHNYVGAFEINIHDWDLIDNTMDKIEELILFRPNEHNEILQVSSIRRHQEEIFVWLGFLDVNVIIILTLMILIGIINMGSALLVLIIIRSNFIGIMKAMGANNWSIRKIFLIQAAYLIGRGMLWGNIIGLGICFAQKYLHLFKLNPKVYYLSEVPIELDFWHWLFLNVGTLVICLVALIIPSLVIARIQPAKTIKFD